MPDFGAHAGFIWTALGVFVLVIGGLIVQTLLTASRTRRRLKRFERDSAL